MGKKNKSKTQNIQNAKKRPNSSEEQLKKTKKQKLSEKLEFELTFDNFFKNKSADNRCLTIKDIQNLILSIYNLCAQPNWIDLKGKKSIQRVVIISLGALDYPIYQSFSEQFPTLSQNQTNVAEMRLPGSKLKCYPPIQTLLTHKKKKNNPSPPKPVISFDTQISPQEAYSTALNYLVTHEELRDNEFPSQNLLSDNSSGYVSAPPSVPFEHHLLSIDCEMCITSKGLELTRCAVVDINGNLLYDQLVKPENEISDYLTKYSGITIEMLEAVSTRLSDVQQYLLSIISQNTILIGHSLENDLKALKFYHDKIIDTSILYPHERGPPSKQSLRNLSQNHLHKEIQCDQNGHSPIEDARSSALLVKLILLNGPKLKHFEEGYESLFDYTYDAAKVKTLMIDRRYYISQYISSPNYAINVSSDDDVVKVFKERSVPYSRISNSCSNICLNLDTFVINDNSNNSNNNIINNIIHSGSNSSIGEDFGVIDFEGIIWTQLLDLQLYLQSHPKENNESFLEDENFVSLCKKTNDNINEILSSLKENSLVVLFTARANERYFKEFLKTMDKENAKEAAELTKRVLDARKGLVFFHVNPPQTASQIDEGDQFCTE